MTNGVYVASKTQHGPMWQRLRAEGVPIVSSWIDKHAVGASRDLGDLWVRNISEAANASALISYREQGEVMKGALAEIGAALAAGVRVFWVGPHDDQTIWRHPLVVVCVDLDDALHRTCGRGFTT